MDAADDEKVKNSSMKEMFPLVIDSEQDPYC